MKKGLSQLVAVKAFMSAPRWTRTNNLLIKRRTGDTSRLFQKSFGGQQFSVVGAAYKYGQTGAKSPANAQYFHRISSTKVVPISIAEIVVAATAAAHFDDVAATH